jgi:DNA-directed RNA polymerase specialized sigma24 family protein
VTRQSRLGGFDVEDADLSSLGRAERRAILACQVNGYTPTEHAEAVGDDPSTVRKTLNRARLKLRRAGEA